MVISSFMPRNRAITTKIHMMLTVLVVAGDKESCVLTKTNAQIVTRMAAMLTAMASVLLERNEYRPSLVPG